MLTHLSQNTIVHAYEFLKIIISLINNFLSMLWNFICIQRKLCCLSFLPSEARSCFVNTELSFRFAELRKYVSSKAKFSGPTWCQRQVNTNTSTVYLRRYTALKLDSGWILRSLSLVVDALHDEQKPPYVCNMVRPITTTLRPSDSILYCWYPVLALRRLVF